MAGTAWSPSGLPSARRCLWTSSSRLPRAAEVGISADPGRVLRRRPGLRVAAVWTPGRTKWRIAPGLRPRKGPSSRDEAESQGMVSPRRRRRVRGRGGDGEPVIHYAVLWVQKAGDDDARLYVGTAEDEWLTSKSRWRSQLVPRTAHALREADGKLRYSGVWGKPPAGVSSAGIRGQFEKN